MKGVQEKLEDFSVVGVKPGFMTHDQEGPDSAFETLTQNSFEGNGRSFIFIQKISHLFVLLRLQSFPV